LLFFFSAYALKHVFQQAIVSKDIHPFFESLPDDGSSWLWHCIDNVAKAVSFWL
jgi:hypothetical protein